MGGWMTYQRMRNRNGLMHRKPDDDPDPYWRTGLPPLAATAPSGYNLIGDMNRMEQDYLEPVYPEPPLARRPGGSSPAEECAAATGVDAETVRKVLRYVFLEQA